METVRLKELKNSGVMGRRPKWLKQPLPSGPQYSMISKSLKEKGLATVCQEANCPNIGECWSAKTATMMVLGDTCTRACQFCNVKTGNPKGVINYAEIEQASEMVKVMNLKYLVITSVDRDDLPDHGASHFGNIVSRIAIDHPDTKVEVLIPDFDGEPEFMHTLAKSNPFVIAQNIETVKRLTHPIRDPRAGYQKTLDALKFYKTHYPNIATKTSLMVGLGETTEELIETMQDLRSVGVNIVTFGQYLRPSNRHIQVQRYYHPDEFEALKVKAYEFGFDFVASGPMVRSSYKAADYLTYLESNGHVVQ